MSFFSQLCWFLLKTASQPWLAAEYHLFLRCYHQVLHRRYPFRSTKFEIYAYCKLRFFFKGWMVFCCLIKLLQLVSTVFFGALFVFEKKSAEFFPPVHVAAANGSKTTALWTSKKVFAANRQQKKQVGFGPQKSNGRTYRSIGWNIVPSQPWLGEWDGPWHPSFSFLRKTWAGCYEKQPAKKIWPIADNDPWKSKTIRIIVPNLGWLKFLLKQSSLVKTYSFNGLWTSRVMIVIFLLDPKPQKVIRPKKSTHKIPLKLV